MSEHDEARVAIGRAQLFRDGYDGSDPATEISGLPMVTNVGRPRLTLRDLSLLLDLASAGAAMMLLPDQPEDQEAGAAKDAVARFLFDHQGYDDIAEVHAHPLFKEHHRLTLGELRKAFGL